LSAKGRNSTADRAIDVLLLFDDQGPVLSVVNATRRSAEAISQRIVELEG